MSKVFKILGVVVLCLPMLFMGWLLLAARWTKMDAMTMRMPEGMKSLVVQAMLGQFSYEDKNATTELERATKLDANSVEVWRKHTKVISMTELSVGNEEATKLYQSALSQEKAGDSCAAEELYTKAAGRDSGSDVYAYTEGMGRAGLRCGDLSGARAGLETAVLKQNHMLNGGTSYDDDELADTKQDLLKDREFLVVVYERQHEKGLAVAVCSEAHPGWKGCACRLGKDGDVTCKDAKR